MTDRRTEIMRAMQAEHDRQPATIWWRGHMLSYSRSSSSYCLERYGGILWLRVSRLLNGAGKHNANVAVTVGAGSLDYVSFAEDGPTMGAACDAAYEKALEHYKGTLGLLGKLGEGV